MTASNTFPYLKKRILVVQEEQYELTPVEVLIFLDLPHVCWSKPVHNRQKNASGLCFYLFGRYRCCVSLNPSFFSFFFFCFYARPSPSPRLAWTEWLRSHLRPSVDFNRGRKTLWKINISYLNDENLYLVCCLILLQVAFDEMQNKVKELNNVIAQNPPDMKKLQLVLQGSVSVQVWIRLVEIARMPACISDVLVG